LGGCSGRLVEIDGPSGIVLGEVEHVRVVVVADAVEDIGADMDGHGVLLLGKAVRTLPIESSSRLLSP
jgi:hypothetical protein